MFCVYWDAWLKFWFVQPVSSYDFLVQSGHTDPHERRTNCVLSASCATYIQEVNTIKSHFGM